MKRQTDRPYAPVATAGNLPQGSRESGSLPRNRESRPAFPGGLSLWIRLAAIGLTAFVSLCAQASGQGTVTTSDGLALSLAASGSVSSLKIGSAQYGSSSVPSGFFYRESTISPPNLTVNGSFESGAGAPTGW